MGRRRRPLAAGPAGTRPVGTWTDETRALPARTPATSLVPAEVGYPRPVTAAEVGSDADDTTLTADLAAALRALPVCQHCGGFHSRACPRVASMTFHPNGSLAGVTFWADGRWPADHVVWPEDLPPET
jgi:hypothetical protein